MYLYSLYFEGSCNPSITTACLGTSRRSGNYDRPGWLLSLHFL